MKVRLSKIQAVPWTELTGDYVDRQAVLAASPELQAAINRHRTAPKIGEQNQTQERDDGTVNRGRESQENSHRDRYG